MKPPAFDYVAVRTTDEAVSQLAKHKTAKILAGGQSLTPMLNFRLVHPDMLIDINPVKELDFIRENKGGVSIGALTRHRLIESSKLVREKLPILAAAAAEVGHLAIRTRGTFGGSLAHADPAAEFPLVALLLDAEIKVRSAKAERTIKAKDFLVSYLQSAVAEGELVTEVHIPNLPAHSGWGFRELCRRPGDFAIAAVGAIVTMNAGKCTDARISMAGVGATALRAPEAEALLKGKAVDTALLKQAGEKAGEAADPSGDVHASAEFRRHLVVELTQRALKDAIDRAAKA
jgi:aerobic carbon-monoxide dehydrogenase medium subunit